MRVLDIFYVRFFKCDNSGPSIGGIETYINELASLAKDNKIKARIFQFADFDFLRESDTYTLYGVLCKRKVFDELYRFAENSRQAGNEYINIIANDTLIPNWRVPNSIVIQHGIGFDDASDNHSPFLLSFVSRVTKAFKRVSLLNNVDEAVCVDNNYICWYRTQTPNREVKLIPIMNFAKVGSKIVVKEQESISLVFARRFARLRGTRLFVPVAKRLLSKYDNLDITFAGEGPEEQYLKDEFKNENRVFFTKYKVDESVHFHQKFHIAVIPSVYSEGTSLSLLEAMSAHCAVVCTNIGGMTNIILDHYNGLMVSPNEKELLGAISELVEDDKLRAKVSANAYETIKSSFSIEKWRNRWTQVINDKFESICPK